MSTLVVVEISLLLLASVVGGAIYYRYRKANALSTSGPSPFSHPYPKLYVYLSLLLVSLLAIKNAWIAVHSPLTWDESVHVLSLLEMDLNHDLNPFRFSHHALSSIMSLLSMWTFGASAEAARYPSILFTCISSVLLFFLFRHRFSILTLSLIVLHAITNRELSLNLLSQRAYSLMFLLAVSIYFIFVKYLESQNGLRSRVHVLFSALCALSFLTHLYSGFFVGLFISYLALYLLLEGKNLSKEKIRSGALLILGGSLWVVVFGATYPSQLKMIGEYGHILTKSLGLPAILSYFVSIFGFAFRKHEWLFSAFAITTIFVSLRALKDSSICKERKVLLLFPLYLCLGFSIVTLVFKTEVFNRMFNWFYLPALFMLSETWLTQREALVRRLGVVVAFTIVGVMPLTHPGISTGGDFPGNLAEFARFVKEVKKETTEAKSCYKFIGEPAQCQLASALYLNAHLKGEKTPCEKKYLLYFAQVPANHPIEKMPDPKFPGATELLRDKSQSRILYALSH